MASGQSAYDEWIASQSCTEQGCEAVPTHHSKQGLRCEPHLNQEIPVKTKTPTIPNVTDVLALASKLELATLALLHLQDAP